MITKFTLTGTDNDGFRHRYSIKKNENFKKVFLKFMEDLHFNPKVIGRIFMGNELDKKGEEVQVQLKISEFEDCIRHFQNSKYDVDVFFGKRKVIIVGRTKERIPMVKHLENKAKWIKAFEIKKIQEENKLKRKLPLQKIK